MDKEKSSTIIKILKEQREELWDKLIDASIYADDYLPLYGSKALVAKLYDCRLKIKEMASVMEELEDALKKD
jgi:hypothetical protein